MQKAKREFPIYDGANYNPSRVAGKGWFTDDFNGRHFDQGAWRPRLGMSRLIGLTTIGQTVLSVLDFRGLSYGLKVMAVQADGNIVEVDTPDPLWTD